MEGLGLLPGISGVSSLDVCHLLSGMGLDPKLLERKP